MFDWNNYLVLAENLLSPKDDGTYDEACLRTAVSRAYYAVFHCARDFAINKNNILLQDIKLQKHTEHTSLQEFFSGDTDLRYKQIGADLSRLHKKRVDCDYKNYQITEGSAKFSVKSAKDILSKILII
ncbi:MAG: hypothetical protein WA093_01985 [Minisyncoccales bacterium]